MNYSRFVAMGKDMRFTMLYDFYKSFLTDKQADVIDLYYNEDLSLAEIAQHSGITRQGVRDNIKRAENVLLDVEEKIGGARRFEEIRRALDKIGERLESIVDYSERNGICYLEREAADIKRLLGEVRNGI